MVDTQPDWLMAMHLTCLCPACATTLTLAPPSCMLMAAKHLNCLHETATPCQLYHGGSQPSYPAGAFRRSYGSALGDAA
jgi:hypothetical protein